MVVITTPIASKPENFPTLTYLPYPYLTVYFSKFQPPTPGIDRPRQISDSAGAHHL